MGKKNHPYDKDKKKNNYSYPEQDVPDKGNKDSKRRRNKRKRDDYYADDDDDE